MIASQITNLRQRLTPRPPAESTQNPAPAPLRQSIAVVTSTPREFFSQNHIMAIAGSALMSVSLLLHLNPSFGLLVGLHVSPPMFVVLFVIGGAMAIYGISRREGLPLLGTNQARTTSMSFLGVHQLEQCLKFCFRFGPSRSRVPASTVEHSHNAAVVSVRPIKLA